MSGTTSEVINLGSYNYLGFSHNDGPCAENAASYIDSYGLHIGGSKHERGTFVSSLVFSTNWSGNHTVHRELEKCIAHFLGVEDAVCFPMGFGTNTMNIPFLVSKDSLILSDALNHSSIALGCRMSGATIKVFKHNGSLCSHLFLISCSRSKKLRENSPRCAFSAKPKDRETL